MSYGYNQGPPGPPYPGQMPQNMMGGQPGGQNPSGGAPYPGGGYNFAPVPSPMPSGMPQPFTQYPSTPYPPDQQNYGAQQHPIAQPQQYHMQQNAPPGAGHYSQPQNPGAYPNIQNPQGPYPGGNQSHLPSTNPYQQSQVPYPSHGNPQPQSHPQYPGHYVPFDTSSTPYSTNAAPHQQNPNPYSGGPHSGGQGMGAAYTQHASTTSFSPQHGAPASNQAHTQNKPSPTVVPFSGFNARSDAEVLRKAMKGWGTDEAAIINILPKRTNAQRQEIALQFKTLHGKDLIKDLKSELSGNLERLVVAMMIPTAEFYAKELHGAMSGIGTDECVLIEVLCTMKNHEIRTIQDAYRSTYGRTLEDDLRSDTSGCFKRLMVSLCCANRDESLHVDPARVQADAQALERAGVGQWGTDESVFNQVLVQRSVAHLQQLFVEYERMTGHDMEQAIKREFSGDIEKGLLAIIKSVKNRPGFFAEQLYKSMKGGGTQDDRLIRLVVTRAEVDMRDIKQAFVQQYGQSLENFISDDCSGDYKKCLLALVA